MTDRANSLGSILFGKIEAAQGYAYISDGIGVYDSQSERIIRLAKHSVYWHQECIRILKEFIAEQGSHD